MAEWLGSPSGFHQNPFVSTSLDAAHAVRFALGFKNAHDDSPAGLPRGLVVTCLVPKGRLPLLRPIVVHTSGIGGDINMHPHRLWEREVIVPGFVDEDLVVSRQVLGCPSVSTCCGIPRVQANADVKASRRTHAADRYKGLRPRTQEALRNIISQRNLTQWTQEAFWRQDLITSRLLSKLI